jgi:hypothetical protein
VVGIYTFFRIFGSADFGGLLNLPRDKLDGFVKSRNHSIFVIPAKAEILMVQFILHWQFLLKPEIEFKIIEPGDRWSYPL